MHKLPLVSVIIPVYNAGEFIERCLDAIIASSYPSFEIIMIDDCSTDESVSIARQKGVEIHQLHEQSGPAIARNKGAKYARGQILLFIDSDIIVRRETITLVVTSFQSNPDIVALFGSYDDDPAKENFISQYRNLFHHFQHQYSAKDAFTFWAGCGAILKKVFDEVGGFDQEKYSKPCIEDIELGYRISKKGYRILLNKDIQVKHLKEWGFFSMLRTDIFQRAIPWSQLILETKFMPTNLNLQMSNKISSISVVLMILMVPFFFLGHTKYYGIPIASTAGIFSLILFINLLILNRKLYGDYANKRGLLFMAQVIPLHLLYFLYSIMSFAFCWMAYKTSILGHLSIFRIFRT